MKKKYKDYLVGHIGTYRLMELLLNEISEDDMAAKFDKICKDIGLRTVHQIEKIKDIDKSDEELKEDAYWKKYDLDEAEMKGN